MRTNVAVVTLLVVGLSALFFGVLLFRDIVRGITPDSAPAALTPLAILASSFLCTAAVLWTRGGAGPSPHP